MEEANDVINIAREISNIFLREKLTAREVLIILRLLESDATVVLVLSQLSEMEQEQKDAN